MATSLTQEKKTSSSKPLNVLKFDSKEENSTPIIKDSSLLISQEKIFIIKFSISLLSPLAENTVVYVEKLHPS